MKKIKWENPDKMLFESGHKTFDSQTNIITTGNIIANTLIGKHVRAHTDVVVGMSQPDRPPGWLQDFDLHFWRGNTKMPGVVMKKIKELARESSVWVYELRHWGRRKERWSGWQDVKVVHGYIITDSEDKALATCVTGPTYKSHFVVSAALPYLAEDFNKASVKHYYWRAGWGY